MHTILQRASLGVLVSSVLLFLGCGKVTDSVDGSGVGGTGGGTAGNGGEDAGTSSAGGTGGAGASAGGALSECPAHEEHIGRACEGPLTCEYGEQTCCGTTFAPVWECECSDEGLFSCTESLICRFWLDCHCADDSCATNCDADAPVPCGSLNSNFDDTGCARPSCQSDLDCTGEDKCYTPLDFGGCAASGFACVPESDGTCSCGGDADCGGSYCVPPALYPLPD